MCGIAGFAANRPESWASTIIERMVERLVHRGPDDKGVLVSDSVALGMRRLSIIDVDHGRQPITTNDGALSIVYNGEIYNYQDIKSELERLGWSFKTNSDTETLLLAYQAWGIECLDRLRGMFAFSILDHRDGSLFIARDRLGIKPLYYAIVGNELIFASEVKAILEHPAIVREVNPVALNDYMTLRYVSGPNTMFKGINKFPPSHYMFWRSGKKKLQCYWRPDKRKPWQGSSREAQEAFDTLFDEATRLRMISERPVGAFLSGGLDSTAIVISLAKQFPERLKTFSVGFDWEGDELSLAAKTAKRVGTDHHEIICRRKDTALLPQIIWHLDEPVGDGIILPMFLLSSLAAQTVTVVQSGEGADEIMGGYFMHRVMKLASLYAGSIPGWLQDKGFLPLVKRIPARLLNRIFDYPGELGESGKQRLVEFLRILRHESTAEQYRFMISLFSDDERQDLLTSDYWHDNGKFRGTGDKGKLLDFNHMLALQFDHWLPDDILCKQDKISMAKSLEARVPFMDHKLVELVNSFPASYKLRRWQGKMTLRRYLKNNGAEDVATRRKMPFYIPIDQYLETGPLAALVDDLLSESSVHRRGVFKWESIRHMRSTTKGGGFLFGKKLFSLAMLELWYRIFIDKEAGWV
jgi:asparagine synthase (glutamine-hydrolysing)